MHKVPTFTRKRRKLERNSTKCRCTFTAVGEGEKGKKKYRKIKRKSTRYGPVKSIWAKGGASKGKKRATGERTRMLVSFLGRINAAVHLPNRLTNEFYIFYFFVPFSEKFFFSSSPPTYFFYLATVKKTFLRCCNSYEMARLMVHTCARLPPLVSFSQFFP